MKRSKRLFVLLGVLAVACLAMGIALHVEQQQEEIRNSGETVLEINADTVESLSWEYDGASFAFQRTDDGWQYDADEAFPVSSDAIDELLSPFASLGATFIIEDVEDYGQYGLDDPLCTIELTTADETYEISLGDFSSMDEERYVSLGDGNVYLAAEDPLNYFDAKLPDLIENDKTPDADKADEIVFTGADTYTVTYMEDNDNSYRADDVYFTQTDEGTLPLDTERVNSYLDTLQYLDLTDYMTYKVTDEQLADYGLDNPELTVELTYTSENEDGDESTETFSIAVSRDPEERAEDSANEDAETEEEEEITAYARVADSPIVYRLTTADYQALMASEIDDLRHDEILSADLADITSMDVSLEGNTYTLEVKQEDDAVTFSYQDEEVDTDDLQSALDALLADSFTDEEPSDKEEIRLTCYLDTDREKSFEVVFYRYDGTNCLAEVDGAPLALVARSAVVDLIEAVNAIVL